MSRAAGYRLGMKIHHAPHALDKRTFATRVAGCSQLPLVSPAE